jgi:hypothetical protein
LLAFTVAHDETLRAGLDRPWWWQCNYADERRQLDWSAELNQRNIAIVALRREVPAGVNFYRLCGSFLGVRVVFVVEVEDAADDGDVGFE